MDASDDTLHSDRQPDQAKVAIDRKTMGARLRTIRKRSHLTLAQLSAASGVAVSTLSKMELGLVSISYEKFGTVARSLGVDISSLFEAAPSSSPAEKRPTVVRSETEGPASYVSDQYSYRMLAVDFPDKSMTPIHTRITARSLDDFPDFVRHRGEEFVLVTLGSLEIRFETGETISVRKGQSAYFDSSVGHVYLSTSRGDAHALLVMTEGRHGGSAELVKLLPLAGIKGKQAR